MPKPRQLVNETVHDVTTDGFDVRCSCGWSGRVMHLDSAHHYAEAHLRDHHDSGDSGEPCPTCGRLFDGPTDDLAPPCHYCGPADSGENVSDNG